MATVSEHIKKLKQKKEKKRKNPKQQKKCFHIYRSITRQRVEDLVKHYSVSLATRLKGNSTLCVNMGVCVVAGARRAARTVKPSSCRHHLCAEKQSMAGVAQREEIDILLCCICSIAPLW